LCNKLNEIWRLGSVAEYNLTGIATNPNEIVRLPIERAAMTFAPSQNARHSGERRNPGAFQIILKTQTLNPGFRRDDKPKNRCSDLISFAEIFDPQVPLRVLLTLFR